MADFLLKEDGDFLLKEDGFKIILDELVVILETLFKGMFKRMWHGMQVK